jgi:hypothetical protein
MLWRFYAVADAPSMKKIADVIASQDEDTRRATANHETVRRALMAIYLPEWRTVEIIFLALCQIGDVDPDDDDDDDDFNRWGNSQDQPQTHRDRLHQCYRLAKFGTTESLPRTRSEKARQEADARGRDFVRGAPADDPWGSAPPAKRAFVEEPPF